MLCLSQHILDETSNNYADAEVVIDLRDVGLGLVTISPLETHKGRVRMGYAADGRVKIYRRRVFDEIERAA